MSRRRREFKKREEHEVEFSRIVAFSDGVFAIAITLLVLNLGIGENLHGESVAEAIWGQRDNLLAYAISFAVIGRFWVVHHRLFGEVTGFDGRLMELNIAYLGALVLIPFSTQVLGDHGGTTAADVLYAGNLALVSLLSWVMAYDAQRAGLTRMDDDDEREYRTRSFFIIAVFLVSIPVAYVAPGTAPLIWLALFFEPTKRRRNRSGRDAAT